MSDQKIYLEAYTCKSCKSIVKFKSMPEGKPWTGLYTCLQEAHGSFFFCGDENLRCAYVQKTKNIKICLEPNCANIGKSYLFGKDFYYAGCVQQYV